MDLDVDAHAQDFGDQPEGSGAQSVSDGLTAKREKGKRTSVACTTCRHQKMKCDAGQPCTRCRKGGYECIYEAPTRMARPVKTGGHTAKRRRTDDDNNSASGPSQPSSAEQMFFSPDQLHGAGLPNEDGWLYSHPEDHLRGDTLDSPVAPSSHSHSSSNRSAGERNASNGFNVPNSGSWTSKHSPDDPLQPNGSNKRSSASSAHSRSARFMKNAAIERMSRLSPSADLGKTHEDRPHSIVQGLLNADRLQQYWQHFHEHCAYRVGWAEEGETLDDALRMSPIKIAAICSVGARALGNESDADACYNEARFLVQNLTFDSELPPDQNLLYDLDGLLVLAAYHSDVQLMHHIVSITLWLGLPSSFAKLTDPELRGQAEESTLIKKGRRWLLVNIYAILHSLFSNQPALICPPRGLVTQQCAILRSSKYSNSALDSCFACHAEVLNLIARAERELGGNIIQARNSGPHITALSNDLDNWWTRWSNTEGSPFHVKGPDYFLVAYQSARMFVYNHGYSSTDGNITSRDPAQVSNIVVAGTCAKAILDAALDTERGVPPYGLSIDFHIISLGFAVAVLFTVALTMPSCFDLTGLQTSFNKLLAVMNAPEGKRSPYAGPVATLHARLETLTNRIISSQQRLVSVTYLEQLLQPQILDADSKHLIDLIRANSPPFHIGIVHNPFDNVREGGQTIAS